MFKYDLTAYHVWKIQEAIENTKEEIITDDDDKQIVEDLTFMLDGACILELIKDDKTTYFIRFNKDDEVIETRWMQGATAYYVRTIDFALINKLESMGYTARAKFICR